MKPKPDPDMVAHAVAQVAAGHTHAQVAQELRDLGYQLSNSTIAVWVRNARKAGAGPTTSQPVRKETELLAHLQGKREAAQAAPKADPLKLDPNDLAGSLRSLVERFVANAESARGNNDKTMTDNLRLAAQLLGDLRQLEKSAAEDKGLIKVSEQELQQAYRSLVQRVINPLRARAGLPEVEG